MPELIKDLNYRFEILEIFTIIDFFGSDTCTRETETSCQDTYMMICGSLIGQGHFFGLKDKYIRVKQQLVHLRPTFETDQQM